MKFVGAIFAGVCFCHRIFHSSEKYSPDSVKFALGAVAHHTQPQRFGIAAKVCALPSQRTNTIAIKIASKFVIAMWTMRQLISH